MPDSGWQDSRVTSLHAFELPVEDPQMPTAWWRRILAAMLLLAGLGAAGLYGYGAVNPRSYVFFLAHFNNPILGLLVVLLLATVAFVLAFPIRSTVIDRTRSLWRTTLLILTAVTLIVFLFSYELAVFRYNPDVLATSPNGQRSVARVALWKDTEVHVYVGSGLSQRDVGSLGAPCGLPAAMHSKFANDNEIDITTAYNSYRIHLETGTGTPLDRFGPNCSG
jgi:hypothetical protein